MGALSNGRYKVLTDVPVTTGTKYVKTIGVVHERIHVKKMFDFQRVFLDTANNSVIYVSIRPQLVEAHLVITINAEGKSWFKSYVDSTWTSDGTLGTTFNRHIDLAPPADALVYYSGTPNVLGTQRFDKLLLGGTGPQSSGTSGSERIETVIDEGRELTIAITNKSGQAKDIGIELEWYEPE